MEPRTRTCSRCKQVLPLDAFHRRRHYVSTSVRSACKACTARIRRTAPPPASTPERRLKEAVRARTARAIAAGVIVPKPCAVCGAAEVEAHHPDYEAPDAHLKVDWLCREHHMAEHVRRAWGRQLTLL